MKNILKWMVIIGGALFIIVVVASVVFIKSFDVKKYKPQIEQAVAENTGRSFTLGDDMDVSIFPWVGVKLSDLHLGNPDGFGQRDMLFVKHFEVRLKVIPLLSKKIEVKTFVLDTPKIYLEKAKAGQANWMGMGKKEKQTSGSSQGKPSSGNQSLPIEGLSVGNFSIINGQLLYVDQVANVKKQVSDLNLKLSNVSLETAIDISLSAKLDGKPLSLKGSAGPIGKDLGKGVIALDMVLKVLNELDVKLKGNIADPMGTQSMDLALEVATFSPRKLFKALNQDFPIKTKDPGALTQLALSLQLKGNKESMVLSDGVMELDDSTLAFTASVKEFNRPNLAFDFQLDSMDLDRYLPEPPAKDGSGQVDSSASRKPQKGEKKKTDYTPLRKLILDGKVTAKKLKAHGAIIENIVLKMTAKNGLITMNPVNADLYSGTLASTLMLNVQKSVPETTLTIDAKNIEAGPLLKDAMQKELIEGTLNVDTKISMAGETPQMIKKTLNGKGTFLFLDGAIIGIDLANAVRNVKVNLGLEKKAIERPRTDFAELKIPFTAKDGLVNTSGANLASPLIRVIVKGDADLVKEQLDLKVDPKFVATLKGQGDTKNRSGLTVPVLITGSFAKPKVRPDLKGMISSGAVPGTKDLENVIGTKEDQEKELESAKEDVKKQIKGLFPGFSK